MSTIQIQRAKPHKTILTGPKITGIIELLLKTQSPIRYYDLFLKANIPFKKSFGTYLKYCTDKDLIINTTVTKKRNAKRIGQSWFVISEKGRQFLELVQ